LRNVFRSSLNNVKAKAAAKRIIKSKCGGSNQKGTAKGILRTAGSRIVKAGMNKSRFEV
jgi:hypothetical protein